ncbi:MAG TPA: serine hydrolase domain-containing protein, partial [Longimicrobiales bacterium]
MHERGFGVADPDGRPVTPRTPFILGSMTKSFTALAVMQLVEQGRVVLDAPVQRYLPWFALRDSAASARITVRQLLNHTSGIPKSAGLEIVRSAEARTLTQERSLLAAVRLTHTPGAVFEYSNANYWVLGRVLEAATDTPYAAFVHEHILAPLGMSHTYTSERDARREGLAQGYRVWFGFPRPEDLPYYERELAVG